MKKIIWEQDVLNADMLMIGKDKTRKIELKESEIQEIIRCMEDVPYGIFIFMNYDKIIKKLK